MAIHTCRNCNTQFEITHRGRPPSLCSNCKNEKTVVKPVDIRNALTDAIAGKDFAQRLKTAAEKYNPMSEQSAELLSAGPEVSGGIDANPDDDSSSDYLPPVLRDSGIDFDAEISYLRGKGPEPHSHKMSCAIYKPTFGSTSCNCGYSEYVVSVGNGVGVVYSGPDASKARAKYREYVGKSEMGYGQVGFEKVTLSLGGAVIMAEQPSPYMTTQFIAT